MTVSLVAGLAACGNTGPRTTGAATTTGGGSAESTSAYGPTTPGAGAGGSLTGDLKFARRAYSTICSAVASPAPEMSFAIR